jgi:hypothetical protein
MVSKFLKIKFDPKKQVFDEELRTAVKIYQKKKGLSPDGSVGEETAASLFEAFPNDSHAKALDAAFGITAVREKAAAAKEGKARLEKAKMEEERQKAKEAAVELAATRKLAGELRDLVNSHRQLVVKARATWDHFKEIRADAPWFVELATPWLPDEGMVKAAESALNQIEDRLAAVAAAAKDYKPGSGEKFDKAIKAFASVVKSSEKHIFNAYEVMSKYREDCIGSAGNWVTGLTVVRDASKATVEVLASVALSPAGGFVVRSLAGAVVEVGTQGGKALAGTSKGLKDASTEVFYEAVVGTALAGLGAGLGKAGDKLGPLVKEALGKLVLSRVKSAALKEVVLPFVGRWFVSAGTKTLEGLIESVGKGIKAGSYEEFAKELAKKVSWENFAVITVQAALTPALNKRLGDMLKNTRSYKTIINSKNPKGEGLVSIDLEKIQSKAVEDIWNGAVGILAKTATTVTDHMKGTETGVQYADMIVRSLENSAEYQKYLDALVERERKKLPKSGGGPA